MPNLVTLIQRMTPDERRRALQVLNVISRPLTPKEIKAALRLRGVSKTQATKLASSVRALRVVAVVGGES